MDAAAETIAAAPAAAPRFRVGIATAWEAGRRGFEAAHAAGIATPFQWPDLVGAWYEAMADRPDLAPLLVSVADGRTGERVLDLALVRRRLGPARVIGFADLDLVDYNAPVLGPAAPTDTESARAMWRAVRRALPGADLVDLRKMPREIAGRPNPLALLATRPSVLNGNLVEIGESYPAYMHGVLRRVVRKELERSWRVFTRHSGARFEQVAGAEARRHVLDVIEAQQPVRMARTGKDYRLDAPHAADFYRRLVEADPGGERIVLLALKDGEEVVAALLGLRDGALFTMIRISSSVDPAWTNCSPGRLVIERTMAHLHADGVRRFDFSVGNYDYKRRFAVVPTPLVDFVQPLTPRGWPAILDLHARAWLRAHPHLDARLRRLLGRPRAQEIPS